MYTKEKCHILLKSVIFFLAETKKTPNNKTKNKTTPKKNLEGKLLSTILARLNVSLIL